MSVGELSLLDNERGREVASNEREGQSDVAPATSSGEAARAQACELNDMAAPAISYAVPNVVFIARIADPVARNNAINGSYHAFDQAMTAYLGKPLVSNWCTYGQHASREAGAQINNLKAGLQVLDDCLATLKDAVVAPVNPFAAWRIAQRIVPTLRRIVGLMTAPGLIQQGLQLALDKAGVTSADINDAIDNLEAAVTFQWTDLIPGKMALEQARVAYDVLTIGGKMLLAIPDVIAALEKVYANMIKGNRSIYENIAPAYRAFLLAGLKDPQGVVPKRKFKGDPSHYVSAAFEKYSEVRQLANEIYCMPSDDPQRAKLISQREALAHEANLLIGYQEQLIILQPIFDEMQEELASMSGTMVLNDPNGVHPLIGNWGDFYTRMGIDASQAPENPRDVTPDNLPPLRDGDDPQYQGTIAQYFEDGLTDRRIHNAPPKLVDH